MLTPPPESRLEAVERQMCADFYEALPASVARDGGISWSADERCVQLTCEASKHPYLNRVHGIGAGDVKQWVGGVAAHYRDREIDRWMIQIAPDDWTPDLAEALDEHGLVRLRGWAKHVGAVGEVRPPSGTHDSPLRVEAIASEGALDWAAIVAPAFSFPRGSEAWLAATVGRSGWHHFVAYDEELPVAGAVLYALDGIGTLGFAATLESHRRRGAQSALIAARVDQARRLGLDYLMTETDEELPDKPNPSTRNIVRAGLPVLYVRENWGPPPNI